MAEDIGPMDTPSPRAGGAAPMPPLSRRGGKWRIYAPLIVLGARRRGVFRGPVVAVHDAARVDGRRAV